MADLAALAVRVRYEAANIWRRVSSPWHADVSPERCSSIFAASFGDNGWHHLRQTLRELDRDPGVDFRDTTLYRFLTRFRPQSIADLVRAPDAAQLPLFVYPWGTFRIGEVRTTKTAATSRFCGPSTDQFVKEEFDRVRALYADLRTHGYQPYQFPHSLVGGTWLEAESGDRRFVVLQGNHRTAILAHLGVDAIAVRPVRGWLRTVRERESARWPLVVSGRCSESYARAIFRWFFENDGHHLGLADR